ncbi:uncharacterized protein CBL_01332 [Carabus blaptoides fortunei]
MEDIDNIILDSLKHLNCPIEDDIRSLKQFDNDMVIKALMSCIDIITPGTGLPHSMPPSMSQRLKLATNIADHIKEIGFRGDIGYQMILYCNEVEIRRLLMFLIERLPREPDKASQSDDSSQTTSLVKAIRLQLSQSLKTLWVPSGILRNGIRHTHGTTIRTSFGHCNPLRCKDIHIPNTLQENSDGLKHYCVHHLSDVTKQCQYKFLIPSLLFNSFNNDMLEDSQVVEIICKSEVSSKPWEETVTDNASVIEQSEVKQLLICEENGKNVADSVPNIIEDLSNNIENAKENIVSLKNDLKTLESRHTKIIETKMAKEKELEISLQNLKIKSKSHALLSNKENINKLKTVVDSGTQKLVELTNQWHQVQDPLLKQYKNLMDTLNVNESEAQELQERLQNAKQKCRKANEELKEKDQLLAQLSDQYSKLTKQTNRSAYTRRILEIISNIKKQSNDIDKILIDTRGVQKEINTLNGQLERSFALSDEIIFRDAKQEDTARKAYKLLATMHTEYGEVVRASTDLGSIIRESRNLQEQVDTEEAREIGARLERVMADLNQVRSETLTLMNQNNN